MDRLVGVGTVTRPQPQTRRLDFAGGGLHAPMAVREQNIAIGVAKVGGSELAQMDAVGELAPVMQLGGGSRFDEVGGRCRRGHSRKPDRCQRRFGFARPG